MLEVTTEKFEEEVLKYNGKVLIDFWAPWCGPCRAQGPILETVAKENPDLKIVKVNVDNEPALAMTYGVMSIPTLLVFENGELKNKAIGLHSSVDIKAML